ncbi:MAG: DNA cytosine methyltransferase [Gammaproteobacteria bacterium]
MDTPELHVLSLCAGVAGLDLGVRLALPRARTVCYVEREAYACEVLASRMAEDILDAAPIWTDLSTFDGRAWRGAVDLVIAGFPCQPFSVAGQRKHEADERHLWPEIARIVSECDPTLVFLENVAIRAFVEPWRDLRGMGFELSRPFAATAAELGAPHLRRRIFVLAYRQGWRPRGAGPLAPGSDESEGEAFGNGDCLPRWPEQWTRAEGKAGPLSWWASEPGVERVLHGVSSSLDRHRALGNAVVPQQASFALSSLLLELPHP